MTNVEPRFGRILTQHERGQRRLSFMLLVAAMGRFAASVGPGGPVQTAVAVRVCLRWLSRCRPRPCPVPPASMPAGDGWAGLHTDTPLPLKHEQGGPNPHLARKRQRASAFSRKMVAVAIATPPLRSKTPAAGAVFERCGCSRPLRTNSTQPPGEIEHGGGYSPHDAPKRHSSRPLWSTAGVRSSPPTPLPRKMPGRPPASRPPPASVAPADSPAHPPIKAVWTGPGGRDPNPRTPPPAATLPQRPPALAPSAAQPGAAHRSSSRPSRQTTSASAHVRPNRATMK